MANALDPLPPRLRVTYIALSEFPSTNGIKVVALALFVGTGVFLAIASFNSYDISEGVLGIWLSADLALLGIGNWAMNIKRNTPQAVPPANVDVEDVSATTGTPAPTKVLTQAGAQLAAEALEARQREIAATSADGAVG